MLAKNLISGNIIPLRTSDTGAQALRMMEELKVCHLPIVNNQEFLGLISEEDIYQHNAPDDAVGNHNLSLLKPYVNSYQHIYEVMEASLLMKISVIPVIDKQNHFLGCITPAHLLNTFTETASLNNPGGIIILEINEIDYSMSQIAQIVESNDAKILNAYITSHPESTQLEITLKINRVNIFPVIQTLERYGYSILASFGEQEYFDDLRSRFDSFMNYLNI